MKKRVKIILFFAFVIFLLLTFMRTKASSNNSANSLYAYLSIPVNLLDYWVNWFDLRQSEFAHGGGFFFGIISWVNWFSDKIGYELPIYTLVSNYILNTQNI
jgi:hypothetical protein